MKIIEDFRCFKNNSHSKSIFAVLINPCFHSVLLFRISNFIYRYKTPIFPKIIWYINRLLFAVDIDYRASIGEGFVLVHGIGVVIGHQVSIGKGVKIYQGVTLGGCGKERVINNKIETQPQIGENCIIYTNTCVFGPVIIKDNTKIKAGQIISDDL